MSREAESMEKELKKSAEACLTKLRDLGQKAKSYIDPRVPEYIFPNLQYVAASILSKEEVTSFDYAEFNRFKINVGQNPGCSLGIVYHNRTAVLINWWKRPASVHGEHRLSDSSVLTRMLDAFKSDCLYIQTGIILLFSVNIPCTIAKHECAKLLQKFAKQTVHRLIVGYDRIYEYTHGGNSLTCLKNANITVFRYREPTDINEFVDINELVDDLVDYQECAEEHRKGKQKHKQKFQCRRLTKEIQAHWSTLHKDWEEM